MMRIYSAPVCPFAQRTRALASHLGFDLDVQEIDLTQRDPAFLELTPTGKVPLLIDGDLKLYESQVVNEYLAEKAGWPRAFASEDPGVRARERLAMKQWDSVVLPPFYVSLKQDAGIDPDQEEKLHAELGELATTLSMTGAAAESLLGFHVAPFWARMEWLETFSPIAGVIRQHEAVADWLQACRSLPAIQATLPDRDATVQAYRDRYVSPR